MKVRLAGIRQNHPVIFGANEGGLIRFLIVEEIPFRGHRNNCKRRHVVAQAKLLGDDRTEAGKLQGRIGTVACESLNRSLRMIPFVRFHGADDRQFVHVLRNAWKNLGDLNSRSVRRNGSESAIPLYVPAIDMADPSFKPDQDHSLSFGSGSGGATSGRCQSLGATEPQKIAEADAKKT